MTFIDLKKAYDSVQELNWKTLRNKYIPNTIIQDMYESATTNVRTDCGEMAEYPVGVMLHQRSALSLYLFALNMDNLISRIQDEGPWCIFFCR